MKAVFPIDKKHSAQITEKLRHAMIEALFRQGLLTEAQRRELCAVLRCGPSALPDEAAGSEKDVRRRPI